MAMLSAKYDVFVSYSSDDQEWVRGWLVPHLRRAHLRVCLDTDCFTPGRPMVEEIRINLAASRKVVLVLSPAFLKSGWTEFESLLSQTASIASHRGLLIPLVLSPCALPESIRYLVHADFTDPETRILQLRRLVATIQDRELIHGGAGATEGHTGSELRTATPVGRILVLCPLFGASKIYYSDLLAAMLDRAKRYGHQLIIQPVDMAHKEPLRVYYDSPSDLDGVIAVTCQVEGTSWLEECKAENLPIVLVQDNIPAAQIEGTTVVSYIQPELGALRELVTHLVKSHRCRRIWLVCVNERGHAIRQRKLDVLRSAMAENGLDPAEGLEVFYIREYTHSEGERAAAEILDGDPSVDAIACLGDVTAIGVMQELQAQGREDVRVTGFDDIELAERFGLTSVDQQIKAIGQRALQDSAIRYGVCATVDPVYIPTTLKTRSSCCAPGGKSGRRHSAYARRLALYWVVREQRVLRAVERMRYLVCAIPDAGANTVGLLGKAPLFPLHVTVKGIFRLRTGASVADLAASLEGILNSVPGFAVRLAGIANHPGDTASIVLDEEGADGFAELQRAVLPVVDAHRDRSVEPEFRSNLGGEDSEVRERVLESGEPFVGPAYRPHITVASGIASERDYQRVKTIIDGEMKRLGSVDLVVDALWLATESVLGGAWDVEREFRLARYRPSTTR